ncbi:hypothetical protein [Brevibacillus parabrevis]|uniref:Uncharacterized protein n=1 Tax=Brevibacillus parabrevis TaxID=54914 RepID=A0A4Y3PUB8_BREPA|nr:hypothetical protein [Brevibacillus parabrevis]MBU8715519.1 hypothetical protein [Brevibacillus parabrevis]MED2254454.1 hypothetical protein [Brevibacillus parabrevis]RNB93902.1 hypothetical protein EDM60_15900 [Brevibacillus parabrevis]GEB34739.1 hypothetical protein BPA01_43190 [Brevibacillus parabrevis]
MAYTYDQFMLDLFQGREVEFTYKEKRYSITNTPNGRCFCQYGAEDAACFANPQELIARVRIEEKSLEMLFRSNEFVLEVLY